MFTSNCMCRPYIDTNGLLKNCTKPLFCNYGSKRAKSKKKREKKCVISEIYGNHSIEVNPLLKLLRYLNIRLFLRPVVDQINNWDFFA